MTSEDLAPQTVVNFPNLENPDACDVVIVGGGPAGLSAALILGRCRRKVLVIDAGKPRNRCSKAMHGYLSRDGMNPADFLESCRRDLETYQTVVVRPGVVVDASKTEDGRFVTMLEDGGRFLSRKLLIATGVMDILPDIEGLLPLYGSSVHHCPYCDGYNWCDQPIAIYGQGEKGFGAAQELTAWSRDLLLCTDGPSGLDEPRREYLRSLRIRLREDPVARLEGSGGLLERIVFQDGSSHACKAMFFVTGHRLSCDLAVKLGCSITEQGCIWTGDYEATEVEGLYCAGDASKNAQLVIVAASEGALAAVSINRSLTGEYKEAKREVLRNGGMST